MMKYNRINNIVGWLVFTISLVTMMKTMAPTAPFWDCGEFLACMNELEVPHPPGAPFYLLLGRVFVMGAGDNVENIAWWGNFMSVVCSAFTVLFIFWTITILAKKILAPNEENPSGDSLITIMMAGVVGALACNFSDSFWFNAVEAEVYAMSSFFTAIVVWLMFKWDVHADEPHSLRYLILIAFMMGLSTGAHLLNLLTIPALGMIYYFRKYKPTFPGFLAAFGVSIVVLAVVQFGIMQFTITLAESFEHFFVGTENATDAADITGRGMGKGTGLIIFGIVFIATLVFGIWYSQKRRMPFLNTALLSMVMIYIGYGTYAMIPIRSAAEPPINENQPSTITSFLKYLRREQYGDRPLFYGPRYNGRPDGMAQNAKNFIDLEEGVPFVKPAKVALADGSVLDLENGGKVKNLKASGEPVDNSYYFEAQDGSQIRVDATSKRAFRISNRYFWDGYKPEYEYPSGEKVFFPRMHSLDGNHYRTANFGYRTYVTDLGADLESPWDDNPSMADDIRFFTQYQVSHMYLRYFMWNFVGRQGDEQDLGWESGLNVFGGNNMPDHIANQQGRNHYFFLPLLLGLLGMVYHFMVRKFDASSTLALFFFTGFAIILYLNQTPLQPRERDYSYVGSFQTFCIWIGLGVVALYDTLGRKMKNSSIVIGAACTIGVPGIMAWQNWDDHSRALNYVAPDSAKNLLESCAKNAILFTNGDNDTFPLWYAQEVENIRPDVRIVNLSLLNTDWYIRQLKKQINQSPAVRITLDQFFYAGEKNQQRDWKPGTTVSFRVDKDKVLANGTVLPEFADSIKDRMVFAPRHRGGKGQEYLLKQDLLILDILKANAEAGWERPIYFASTIPSNAFIGLDQQGYFQAEGLAYRVVPVKEPRTSRYFTGWLNKDRSYDLIMNKFAYRELANPNVYVDDHVRSTILGNLRTNIFRLGNEYIEEAAELEMQNKMFEARIKSDSTSRTPGWEARVDSMKAQMQRNLPQIEESRKRAKNVLDVIGKRAPVTVIPSDPSLIYMVGAAYGQLKDVPSANQYLDLSVKLITETIDYEELDQNNDNHMRMMQVMAEMATQYENIGEYEKAAKAAEWMFSKTNDKKFNEQAKRLRSKVGVENPGQ